MVSSKAKIPFLSEVEGEGTVRYVESEAASAARPDLVPFSTRHGLYLFGPEDSNDIDLLGLLARANGIDTSTPILDQPVLGGMTSKSR